MKKVTLLVALAILAVGCSTPQPHTTCKYKIDVRFGGGTASYCTDAYEIVDEYYVFTDKTHGGWKRKVNVNSVIQIKER